MTNYKNKILKYKTKYLNLIKKKNKINGGYGNDLRDITVDTFIEILSLTEVRKGLNEHAHFYMFERDIGHDFKQNETAKNKVEPVPGYFIHHPSSQKINPNDFETYKQNIEGEYTFNYLFSNYDLRLFYIKKDLLWEKYPNEPKKNFCYIDTTNNCPIINYSNNNDGEDNPWTINDTIIKKKEYTNLPISLGQGETFIHVDSSHQSKWHKFNLSWQNLFDSANFGGQNYYDIPKGEYNYFSNKENKDDISNLNLLLNAKWQQLLIFTWYTKTGTDDKEGHDYVWPNNLEVLDGMNLKYNLCDSNPTISKKNYKNLYIALNIMRLMNLKINIKNKSTTNAELTAVFYFQKYNKFKFNTELFNLKKSYNDTFNNILNNFIDDEMLTKDESESFPLPFSQAESYHSFMTDSYQEVSRSQGKSKAKIAGIKKHIIPVIEKICDRLDLDDNSKNYVKMLIGMLFKYSIGDTSFILGQIYDNHLRGNNFTRSVDGFLNMRNTMFNNKILGSIYSTDDDLPIKNKFYNNLITQLIGEDNHIPNNDYQYYYGIKDMFTVKDFLFQYNVMKQRLDQSSDFIKTTQFYTIYNKFYMETLLDPDVKQLEALIQTKELDELTEFNKISKYDSIIELYKLCKRNSSIFELMSNIINDIEFTEPLPFDNKINLIIEPQNEFYNNLKIIIENFIFSLIRLYDARTTDPIKLDSDDIIKLQQFTYVDTDQHFEDEEKFFKSAPKKNQLKKIESIINDVLRFVRLFNSLNSCSNQDDTFEVVKQWCKNIFNSNTFIRIFVNGMNKKLNISARSLRDNSVKEILTIIQYNISTNSQEINIKDFFNTFYDLILLKVVDNAGRGWMAFENFSNMFIKFKDELDIFYIEYILDNSISGGSITNNLLGGSFFAQTGIINYISHYNKDLNLIDVVLYFINELNNDSDFTGGNIIKGGVLNQEEYINFHSNVMDTIDKFDGDEKKIIDLCIENVKSVLDDETLCTNLNIDMNNTIQALYTDFNLKIDVILTQVPNSIFSISTDYKHNLVYYVIYNYLENIKKCIYEKKNQYIRQKFNNILKTRNKDEYVYSPLSNYDYNIGQLQSTKNHDQYLIKYQFIKNNLYIGEDSKYDKFLTLFNKCLKLYFFIDCKKFIGQTNNNLFDTYIKNLYEFIDEIINMIYNKNINLLLDDFDKKLEIEYIINDNQYMPVQFNMLESDIRTIFS